jgi:HK97 family phage major capsid protein
MVRQFPISPSGDALLGFRRSLTVKAIAGLTDRDVNQVAERLYGKEVGATITKAAVAPADTATSAWAGALVPTIVGPFLRSLTPKSAAAQLIELGTVFDLRRGSISLPNLSTEFPNGAWVQESGPAPVLRGTFAATTLTPKKLMVLSALTNELAERSAEDAERIISDLLTDAVSRELDATMFSADAATATAPAGLLNGIAATAGTAGGGQTAMATDLRALTAAVATAGGGAKLVVIASPAQAMSLQVLGGGGFTTPIIVAPTLPAGTVIVLDAGAFVSGF